MTINTQKSTHLRQSSASSDSSTPDCWVPPRPGHHKGQRPALFRSTLPGQMGKNPWNLGKIYDVSWFLAENPWKIHNCSWFFVVYLKYCRKTHDVCIDIFGCSWKLLFHYPCFSDKYPCFSEKMKVFFMFRFWRFAENLRGFSMRIWMHPTSPL